MSTPKKIADPESAARKRRRWIFLAGAGLGWALAQLAGTLLDGELQTLKYIFLPLSALAGGLAALAGTARDAVRRRRLGIVALRALALGLTLLVGLYLLFARRVAYGDHRSVAYLVSLSRSQHCECPVNDKDDLCIQKLTLQPGAVQSCWNGIWAVKLALALSYLLTLGSAGTVAGLLMFSVKPWSPEPLQGYLDFDIWIDQKPDGRYRAKAWSSTAGFEATQHFSLPASLAGGELGRFGGGAFRGGSGSAVDGASREQAGGELFRAVFQGELLKAFQGCLAKVQGGPGLRIRLRLNDVPHLAGLPWEYLCDAEGRGFLALSSRTPIVRYLELSEVLGTLVVEPPLRVLVVISTPGRYDELAAADEEWRRLGTALGRLRNSGLIEVERLEHPTFAALERRLRSGEPVHALHFVGHGGFSKLREENVLVFEDENGNGVPVGGQSLAGLFEDYPSLRLAVLNACSSARSSQENAFASIAQVLVQRGRPAVIAMQAEVMDETACSFAEKFYRALADGLPVDACVGEVRRALAAEHNPEWGTPVLYLRATDGRLFEGLNQTRQPEIYPV